MKRELFEAEHAEAAEIILDYLFEPFSAFSADCGERKSLFFDQTFRYHGKGQG
jgi:hypothetical protein